MKTFLVHIIREFDGSKELMNAHAAHIMSLADTNRLVMFGAYGNIQGGAYVFKAESLEEAEKYAHLDPVIAQGIAQCRVFEWNAQQA